MASVSQFPNVIDRLKIPCAVEIATLLQESDLPGTMRDTVERYGDEILAEMELMSELRSADAQSYAQRCLLFAICSPQCDFDVNVRVANRAFDGLYNEFTCVEDVYQCITDGGRDNWFLSGGAARAIWHNLEWLRNVSDSDMDKASILALRKAGTLKGLGPKTTAMALALYDPESEVYTLDVHMLRGILRAIGWQHRLATAQEITDAAYPVLEQALIQLHREVFGGVLPIFVSQWALWSEWRTGSHIEHLPIFGLGVA